MRHRSLPSVQDNLPRARLADLIGNPYCQANRLKGVVDENARPKRRLADAMLDNAVLKDLQGKKQ